MQGRGDRSITAQVDGPFLVTGEDLTITLDLAGQSATFTVPGY